jgi:hypothetical protein
MMTDGDGCRETARETFLRRSSPWSPVVGDAVLVRDCRLAGTVIQTTGVHEARIRVSVATDATGTGREAVAERQAARRASRWYGLDELEPPS